MKLQEPPLYLINKTGYKGLYPPFYNPAEFSWVKEVEKYGTEIAMELAVYGHFNAMNAPHVKGENGWKGLYLINFSWRKHATCKQFPNTMKALQAVPHLTFAAFSLLEPGSSLEPHWGDTNTVIRCAMGIEVPESAPVCALKVGNEVKSWEEGKLIMFSECHLHSAWNYSNKRRIVFSFDTLRPEFVPQKKIICARVLAAETLFFLTNKFHWFSFFDKHFYHVLYWSATIAWYLYLPIQRRISFMP